jgi:cell shape-determining protein MreC
MSSATITPSEIEMIAYNAGYRAAKQESEAEIQALKAELANLKDQRDGLYHALDVARTDNGKLSDLLMDALEKVGNSRYPT